MHRLALRVSSKDSNGDAKPSRARHQGNTRHMWGACEGMARNEGRQGWQKLSGWRNIAGEISPADRRGMPGTLRLHTIPFRMEVLAVVDLPGMVVKGGRGQEGLAAVLAADEVIFVALPVTVAFLAALAARRLACRGMAAVNAEGHRGRIMGFVAMLA